MKIKPKVTMATASLLQLVLLSAITSVEFHPLNGYSTGIISKSSMEYCESYKNIGKWFDLQDAAANSLQRHYLHMEEALGYLTSTEASTNCCFYDKDLMQSVMENINKIEQQSGINGSKTLSPSGDMRIDLNKIILRIKKLVSKGFENCCSQMEESVKKIKKNFNEQLGIVKHKLNSEASEDFSKDSKELEEKHHGLRDKIKDIKERLHNLESKKIETGHQNSCCEELNTKTEALEKQIEAVRIESMDKANQFESQLNDIENMLVALKNRTKTDQGEIFEKELENCKEKFEILTMKPCFGELIDRLRKLQENVTSLINSMDSKNENNIDSKLCLENDKRMVKIKELTNKTEIFKPGNNSVIQIISALAREKRKDRIMELEQEVHDLQEAANKSQISCENIGKINTFAENLQIKMYKIKQIYLNHLKENKLEFEDLKNQLNEALTKLGNIKNKDKDLEKLKNLQVMLQKLKSELKVHEDEVKKLLHQKNNDSLVGGIEKVAQNFDQFWSDVDVQLSQLEGQQHGLDLFMEEHKDLSQRVDKPKLSMEGLQKVEKQYHIEQEKLKELENKVDKCRNACREVPKMHILIKYAKNIMQGIRDKKYQGS